MPELQIILTAIQDMKDSHNKCMESFVDDLEIDGRLILMYIK